jgi:hypothetical protein
MCWIPVKQSEMKKRAPIKPDDEYSSLWHRPHTITSQALQLLGDTLRLEEGQDGNRALNSLAGLLFSLKGGYSDEEESSDVQNLVFQIYVRWPETLCSLGIKTHTHIQHLRLHTF